ncbi:P-type cation-transporting ATPase [Neoconidiobolus thromboides FSU 785]|nr:P-type cation-transporting ATPase [Neoconidiobolus thromboides FSU 785]
MSESKSLNIDEHQLTVQQICSRYNTFVDENKPSTSAGLTFNQADKLRYEYGPNLLTPPKKTHPAVIFFKCLFALFNILLLISAILTFVLFSLDTKLNKADMYLGIILIVVAFINATIEFIQIQKSAALLDSFLKMVPQLSHVIRENKMEQINASELVVGDVVFIKMGDKVPADLRLFYTMDLKVDNSSLTGESDPQPRKPSNEFSNPLEATNLAFNSTLVVSGEGYGIVVRTGDQTILGQIANLTGSENKGESPLTLEINRFIGIISTLAFSTAIIFLIVSIVKAGDIHISLNFAIGTFVAWIPEGLPITVTMLLTIAAGRMANQKVLVKDLKGVETLGSITLLATDKTGTLTKNQMTVTTLWTNLEFHENLLPLSSADVDLNNQYLGVENIIMNSALNSQVKFDSNLVPFSQRKAVGDATELGLTRFAYQHHQEFDNLPSKFPKVFSIPFNSENKWAMSIHRIQHGNGDLILFIKGAPERVLKTCSHILLNRQEVPLTQDHHQQFKDMYERMASKGHRVIAFAELKLPRSQYPVNYNFDASTKNFPQSGLVFVGLASLEDPPKHGVREAIGKCRLAGIKVMMVTGDHPLTAEAIARKINLMVSDTKRMVAERTMRPIEEVEPDEYDAIVIHGEEIDNLDDEMWDFILSKQEIVFARTSPKHKLEIVKRAQSMGHIVGVTGDGVNDSPALKKADLGIAMNESGSDVSKDAASMILLDDNFASTIRGIEEGRLIFMNLKKSVQYTITHSIPEILPQLLFVMVPIPLPLTSIQIIVIDLGFELFTALSYAFDPPETATGLMRLPPRKPVDSLSVERFRRIKQYDLIPHYDYSSGHEIPPSAFAKVKHSLSNFFSPGYWKACFSPNKQELLVDFNILSWAYFEVGMIETGIAHLAFFLVLHSYGITIHDSHLMQNKGFFKSGSDIHTTSSGDTYDDVKQIEILSQAQSIYYLSVMILQAFNLFASKSRLAPPFGRHMFRNKYNFIGLFVGFLLGFIIVYVPGVNTVFQTSSGLSPIFWLVPIGGGLFILAYSAVRFYILGRAKPNPYFPEISGLQMHPTLAHGGYSRMT